MGRKLFLLLISLLAGMPAFAQIQTTCYGVKPTENITTFEVNPSLTAVDDKGSESVSSVSFKTYRVINPQFNWGVEVPFSRYESPEESKNGLGDVLLSATAFHPDNQTIGIGAKLETVLPTASSRLLGSGKVVVSPSVFTVIELPNQFYVAAEYKHYLSIGGRTSVNYMRPRLTLGYTSVRQWYALTNLYYYVDLKNSRTAFVPEVEVGTLINDGTMFYLNMAKQEAGGWKQKDWSVSIGFKLLYL